MSASKVSDAVLIREERPEDYDAVAEVLDRAFGGTYESQLVSAIRASSNYVKELSLVANYDGAIAGCIMLSYVPLETIETSCKVLALGPVAVSPDVQNEGIGSQLIHQALSRADGMSADTIVLLGHPEYYPRFGFVPASDLDIYPPVPWNDNAFMVRSAPGVSSIKGGIVNYPDYWCVNQSGKGGTLELRPAGDEDIGQVARVFKISFRYALPYLPNLHSANDDFDYFKTRVFVENQVWVAESKGEESSIIGFIAFNSDTINQLYVLPFARGQSIGSQLLKIATGNSKQLNLWAFQRNTKAIQFYERHGFVQIRKTDGADNEEQEPDVLMEWKAPN